MIALVTELLLQRLNERPEHVEHHAPAGRGREDIAHILIDQRHKDDGSLAFAFEGLIDFLDDAPRLVHGIHERTAYVTGISRELRQDRIAERLGRDAGAIGNKKYR